MNFPKNHTEGRIKKSQHRCALGSIGIALLTGLLGTAQADPTYTYKVTISNLAHGEFAQTGDRCRTGPIMGLFAFATHEPGFQLFELGRPVSGELAVLAESGGPFQLVQSLSSNPKVENAFSIPAAADFPAKIFDGVLCTGENLTTTIRAKPNHRFSMAAMIFPTNDGFIALNGVELPKEEGTKTYFSPVYDAGSESNDELCDHMPSVPSLPGCHAPVDTNTDPTIPDPHTTGGPGLGEGYAHFHSGIHGIGDLQASQFDWSNPVASITIRRIR